MTDWYAHEGEKLTTDALKHVHSLAKDGFKQKAEVDRIKVELRAAESKLQKITDELLPMLKDAGLSKVEIDGCGKIVVDNKISVKVPKEPELKDAFFRYLREKGIFDQLATVHSATLNAFYNAEIAAAREDGKEDFKIPGLEPSGEWSKLRFKA